MTIKKFDQIDSLRFFAVFAVVCAHWRWYGNTIMDIGPIAARGVDLFFVISGFLITLGLIRAKEKDQSQGTSLYKFYIRRFLRIFPIYYLTIFIVYIFWHKQMADYVWWFLLYISNFHSIKTQSWGVGGQFWSLAVEEQFDLVWPFLILFVPNNRLLMVIISSIFLSLAAKVYWALNAFPFWTPYMHPIGSLDALALGALLAYFFYFHSDLLRKWLFSPLFIFAVITQLCIVICFSYSQLYYPIFNVGIRTSFGIFCFWLIGRATFGFTGAIGYVLDERPLQYIGKISYGIYLFHDFVPGMLMGLKYPEDDNLRFLMNAIVTVGLASISWYFFESRILKLKERFE